MTDPRQLQFWDDEEGELWDALNELLVVTLMDGITEGVKTLPANIKVLADWNYVNEAVLKYIKSYRLDWIRKITETTRQQVQTAISDWIREGSPLSALETRLQPVFGEVRAKMIAATEVTRVYAQGNQEAWESTGVVSKMVWMTADDDLVCEICGPLAGTEMGIGDTDAMPPGHVNCRCYLQPFVDEDLINQRRAERLGIQ